MDSDSLQGNLKNKIIHLILLTENKKPPDSTAVFLG